MVSLRKLSQKNIIFFQILERNMSLSGQYLEELSRRYKKQVEEMQRSLERAVTAMSEESRKGEEREAKIMEEIVTLKEEIATLKEEMAVVSKSFETMLYDQDSWRSRFSTIIQHVLLICLEIIIIILILSYCRRGDDFEEEERFQPDTKKQDNTMHRKGADNFGSHNGMKKTKKRRPSEIASHISSTYHELMIDDRPHETTKKERKKKRKKETLTGTRMAINIDAKREAIRYKNVLNVIPGGTMLPSRRASSIDPPHSKESQNLLGKRPESAPETTVGWFDGQIEKTRQMIQLVSDNKGMFGTKSEQSLEFDRQVDELYGSNSSSATMDRSAEESLAIERKIEASRNSSCRSGTRKDVKGGFTSYVTFKHDCNRERLNDKSSPFNPANLGTRTVDVKSERSLEFDHRLDELSESNSSSPSMGRSAEKSITVERKTEASRNSSFRSSIRKGVKATSASFMAFKHERQHSSEGSSLFNSANLNTQIGGNVNGNPANGLIEESYYSLDESRSSSVTPTLDKKEKKSTGLKKMVRKFF